MPINQLRVVAPLHYTTFQVVAEGVRPFTYLFVDLLDHALLRLFRTITFSMYLLEELADARLARVVDDDDALDHRLGAAGVPRGVFGFRGLWWCDGCPGRAAVLWMGSRLSLSCAARRCAARRRRTRLAGTAC